MKTFEDLNFESHPNSSAGFMSFATLFFDNGYGVSVITGGYGNNEKPYELAVLHGDESESAITYNTPITDDVLGWLTDDDVTNCMAKIQQL